MRSPAYLVQPNIQRLPNLLRDVQEGEIRIPRFQRPFVWTDEQRMELLESIYAGIPIGSILLWRTRDHDLRCYDHLGPFRLAWSQNAEEEHAVRQYVLDGHQRLTTLFVALGEGLIAGDGDVAESAQSTASQIEQRWPIYFNLEDKTFEVHNRRSAPPDTWLPISILFDPYKLYDFQKRLLDLGADRALTNRAEALASTFKDYSVPVVPIATEDLELATSSFQRVNRGGTPMNEVHMVSALTWTPEFDLNERIREIKIELGQVGWQALDEKMVLNTCKAILDLDIYYAKAREIRDALRKKPDVLEEATSSLKAAADFLREHCRVYGPAVLPYSFQIVLLAEALRLATDGFQQQLSTRAKEFLETWFWITTYTEHFAGISAGRLGRTLDHIRQVAIENVGPELIPEMNWTVTPPGRFDFRTARSRAIALRMADLQEKAGLADKKPYQLLADHGGNAMPMLFLNREIENRRHAEGPENRILVSPREASRIRRLLRDPTNCPSDLWAAYAIDTNAVEVLPFNIDAFLDYRNANLLNLEEEFVEMLGLTYERG